MPNYVAPIVDRLKELLPDCEPDLIRLYALLALAVGVDTTERDVHDAWSLWRNARDREHPALVPFGELSPQSQALDTPYAQAIRKVAEEVWS
jgi:hypothetical protein